MRLTPDFGQKALNVAEMLPFVDWMQPAGYIMLLSPGLEVGSGSTTHFCIIKSAETPNAVNLYDQTTVNCDDDYFKTL